MYSCDCLIALRILDMRSPSTDNLEGLNHRIFRTEGRNLWFLGAIWLPMLHLTANGLLELKHRKMLGLLKYPNQVLSTPKRAK